MSKFSIICCISKIDVFDECLLDSINKCRKDHDIEIIPILNFENQYSASIALNLAIQASRSEILIFVHQDVRLLGNWFDELDEAIKRCPDDWAIIGAAGIAYQYKIADIGNWGGALNVDTVAVGSVWDSDDKLDELPYWNGIKELTEMHCADECLFILRKSSGLKFDKKYTGFHFYGVDLCLQARDKGYKVYGANLPIVHYGKYSASFTGDRKYWTYFRYLYNKWNSKFPELLGTHMHWSMNGMTSYISISMEDDQGSDIIIRAMGIKKAKILGDEAVGIK